MMENALQKNLGWATDGGGSDIIFFKNLFYHGTTA